MSESFQEHLTLFQLVGDLQFFVTAIFGMAASGQRIGFA